MKFESIQKTDFYLHSYTRSLEEIDELNKDQVINDKSLICYKKTVDVNSAWKNFIGQKIMT